jgi:general secretion pathway protein N
VKRGLWITLLAVVAFVAILLARMPAGWILPSRTAQGGCASLDGSLWSGACSGLTVGPTALGDVSWELRPLRLLRGRLAAHLSVTGPVSANGDVELGFGEHLTARNLSVDVPLDPRVVPGVPQELSGRAHAELALVEIEHGVLTQLKGRIEAHDLVDHAGATTPLGSYVVEFPGDSGDTVGKLHDLSGPLALEGTLKLTRQGGYELEGLIAPRADAPPELVSNLRFLGSPDATGRRTFSLSGTF